MILFLALKMCKYIIKISDYDFYIEKVKNGSPIKFTNDTSKAEKFSAEEKDGKLYLDVINTGDESVEKVKEDKWFENLFGIGNDMPNEKADSKDRFYITDPNKTETTEIHWNVDSCLFLDGSLHPHQLKLGKCMNHSFNKFDLIPDVDEASEKKEEINKIQNTLHQYKNNRELQEDIDKEIRSKLRQIDEKIKEANEAKFSSRLSSYGNYKYNKKRNMAETYISEDTIKDIEKIKLRFKQYNEILKEIDDNYQLIAKENEENHPLYNNFNRLYSYMTLMHRKALYDFLNSKEDGTMIGHGDEDLYKSRLFKRRMLDFFRPRFFGMNRSERYLSKNNEKADHDGTTLDSEKMSPNLALNENETIEPLSSIETIKDADQTKTDELKGVDEIGTESIEKTNETGEADNITTPEQPEEKKEEPPKQNNSFINNWFNGMMYGRR